MEVQCDKTPAILTRSQLNDLKNPAEKVTVRLSHTDELYALRRDIHLVRKRLKRL